MAGFWVGSFSGVPDLNGKPRVGAKAYFFAGGTSLPITVYQNYDLSVAHPNPVQTDGNGNFPAVFLNEADAFYRVRTVTASGVVIYDSPATPIIGPSDSGGGAPPSPVDPDSLFETGDMMIRFGSETRSGFVRLNGRSIGSATSGAAERANSDTQPLYSYLWNVSTAIVISGGRGGSAAADFGANKPLVLPDWRGRALVGIDNMGNAAAGRLTAATTIGWTGGEEKHQLVIAEMPAHTHSVSGTAASAGAHTHPLQLGGGSGGSLNTGGANSPQGTDLTSVSSSGAHTHDVTGTAASVGGGTPHNVVQPSGALSVYMRL